MKIEIPKIVEKLALAEYAPEFGAAVLEVWVNPPRGFIEDLNIAMRRGIDLVIPKDKPAEDVRVEMAARMEEILTEQLRLFSELLSQGSEASRLPAEDLRTMVKETAETDPMFWAWVKRQIVDMINGHRSYEKKD